MRQTIFGLGLALLALASGAGVVETVRLHGRPPRPTPNLAAYVDRLLAENDVAGARDALRLHLLLEPSEPIAQRLAQVATRAGDRESQLLALRKWVSMRPANAQAHAALAANLAAWPDARRGELAEALAHGRRAVALDGDLALAHAALGVAQLRLGRVEPGAASLRNALRLDPTLEFARSALAGLGAN